MRIKLKKLITKEITIAAVTIFLVLIGFMGFVYSYYRIIKDGEQNLVHIGDFSIEMCADSTCSSIANLGGVIGTAISDSVTVQTVVYPMETEEALEGTPFAFVIKNTGDMTANVSLNISNNWDLESSLMLHQGDYNNIMIGYRVLPEENIVTQSIVQENVFKNLIIDAGSYKIIHVWIWGDETISNDVIEKFLVSKLSVSGEYIPEDPNYYRTLTKEFAYTGGVQEFIVPSTGQYLIELWGASEPNTSNGGAYTAGTIGLTEGQTLYFYVGQEGQYCIPYSSCGTAFNGGGSGGFFTQSSYHARSEGGSGATDVRLTNGNWDNFTSLKSRIMVAAGSGSFGNFLSNNYKGAAGGLVGYDGEIGDQGYTIHGTGATQTVGGYGYNFGSFGIGANGFISIPNAANCNDGGGGGGGYYGGGSAQSGNTSCSGTSGKSGGGGGSSYISGHTGCVAITNTNPIASRTGTGGSRCLTGTSDNLCSVHYSTKAFSDTVMIDGTGYSWTTEKYEVRRMPSPTGGYYPLNKGHFGNGYAKISKFVNLTIDLDGGQTTNNQSGNYAAGTALAIVEPTKSGYSLKEWKVVSGTGTKVNGSNITLGVSNVTLKAIWQNDFLAQFTYTVNGQPGVLGTDYIIYNSEIEGLGNWRIKFLTSGTLVITSDASIDAFLVGGGSGGGISYLRWAGDYRFSAGGIGGSSGYITLGTNLLLQSGTYACTIGAGGESDTSGQSTSLGTLLIAEGGDFGLPAGTISGATGGGKGGSASYNTSTAAVTRTTSAAGASNGGNSTTYGMGIPTYEFREIFSNTLYAGGGGGGGDASATSPGGVYPSSPGGAGGGGNGGYSSTYAQDGVPNTGSGGGGGGNIYRSAMPGGTGGSGIIVIRNHRTRGYVSTTNTSGSILSSIGDIEYRKTNDGEAIYSNYYTGAATGPIIMSNISNAAAYHNIEGTSTAINTITSPNGTVLYYTSSIGFQSGNHLLDLHTSEYPILSFEVLNRVEAATRMAKEWDFLHQ